MYPWCRRVPRSKYREARRGASPLARRNRRRTWPRSACLRGRGFPCRCSSPDLPCGFITRFELAAPSCVDGPRLARGHWACSAEVACSHVSGLLVQSGWTAGPDGVREPSPHHSNGIDVPMKRQVWLGCVGSTDCAITRHCSLASSRTWLSGLSRRGHALVVLMPVHHRPGDARGLVG